MSLSSQCLPPSGGVSMALVPQTAFVFPPIPNIYFFPLSVFLILSPFLPHPTLYTHIHSFERSVIFFWEGSSWNNLYMMKGNNNAFIFQMLQNLLAVSINIIIICVWKSPRKLTLFYCIYSEEWMKKSERGKESKYLITSIIFPDIHLCENPGILSGLKAIGTCLVKWADLLIQRSS